MTGVYPFDPERVKAYLPPSPKQTKCQTLAEKTGLAYIPLYSPLYRRVPSKHSTASGYRSATPQFESSDEDESSCIFERSLSEKDLVGLCTKRATSVTRFLNPPKHPSKLPAKNQKSCGKVLTSLENIHAMEEKQDKGGRSKKERRP